MSRNFVNTPMTTKDLHGKSRGFVPQGIRHVEQPYIPGTQPEVIQFRDPVSGAMLTIMDAHNEQWDSSIVSALQAAYPGIKV